MTLGSSLVALGGVLRDEYDDLGVAMVIDIEYDDLGVGSGDSVVWNGG